MKKIINIMKNFIEDLDQYGRIISKWISKKV